MLHLFLYPTVPHEEILHLFGLIKFFLNITGIFSRSPKTSQFAVGSGAILLKQKSYNSD